MLLRINEERALSCLQCDGYEFRVITSFWNLFVCMNCQAQYSLNATLDENRQATFWLESAT